MDIRESKWASHSWVGGYSGTGKVVCRTRLSLTHHFSRGRSPTPDGRDSRHRSCIPSRGREMGTLPAMRDDGYGAKSSEPSTLTQSGLAWALCAWQGSLIYRLIASGRRSLCTSVCVCSRELQGLHLLGGVMRLCRARARTVCSGSGPEVDRYTNSMSIALFWNSWIRVPWVLKLRATNSGAF